MKKQGHISVFKFGGVVICITLMMFMASFMVLASADANDVIINKANFPDDIFREYVSVNFDADSDGVLSEDEWGNVISIDVSGDWQIDGEGNWAIADGGITSLKGIEYFPALRELRCANNAGLTELCVDGLRWLWFLECFRTGIKTLDVSENLSLDFLDCRWTGITSLNLQNNTALEELQCSDTGITSLDVSNNTLLETLEFGNTGVVAIDLSNNDKLTWLGCGDTYITSLDVSGKTSLEYLYCSNTGITSLDVSDNELLWFLGCSNTGITSLDVSKNVLLLELYCYDTGITSLNIKNNTALMYLKCGDTEITSLDVSNNTALIELDCSENAITSLDVSNNTSLEYLNCSKTALASIDLSKNTSLRSFGYIGAKYDIGVVEDEFDLSNIKGFDWTKASEWNGATCIDGKLTDFYGNRVNVEYTYDCGNDNAFARFTLVGRFAGSCVHEFVNGMCSGCGIKGVEVNAANFPDAKFREYIIDEFDHDSDEVLSEEEIKEITMIDVQGSWDGPDGGITSLKGIEYFTELHTLMCSYNQGLKSIDISKNAKLRNFACQSTGIMELDISKNAALEYFWCDNTGITNLKVNEQAVFVLFAVDWNIRDIGKVRNSYDLSKLSGFDVTKASNWNGATYSDGKLIDFYSETITYTYDCGNGLNAEFVLKAEIVRGYEPDIESVVDFVSRMYRLILEREPDAGADTWVNNVMNGFFTGADVATGFIMSEEFLNKDISNEEFVKIMYRAFFNREADAGGLATWKGCLDEGYMKKFVFAGFANSNEFQALCDSYGINRGDIRLTLAEKTPNLSEQDFNVWQFVERLYSEVMGRNPDQTGMDTWVGVLKAGTYTGAQVAEGFIISDEFLNKDMTNEEYVRIMYRAFFNRDADTDGFKTWTEALETGWTKEAVFAGFANSSEFGRICDEYGIIQGSVAAE